MNLLKKAIAVAVTTALISFPSVTKAEEFDFNCFNSDVQRNGRVEYGHCVPHALLVFPAEMLPGEVNDGYRQAMVEAITLATDEGEYKAAKTMFEHAASMIDFADDDPTATAEYAKYCRVAKMEALRGAKAANDALYIESRKGKYAGYATWVHTSGIRSSMD